MTRHVSVAIDDHRCCPPPAVDAEPSSDDDSDHDHPLQEPEFVIHAVDDDAAGRGRRPPARRGVPAQQAQHPQPPAHAAGDDRRKADRVERLRSRMLMPQFILCGWTLVFCGMMIYFAENPDMWPNLTWVIVYSVLIMVVALVSALLSYLGVYVYDS